MKPEAQLMTQKSRSKEFIVYELLVDYDGTTRSSMQSEGLFLHRVDAVNARHRLKLKDWQPSRIVGRVVLTS